jgi:hypothetical protein
VSVILIIVVLVGGGGSYYGRQNYGFIGLILPLILAILVLALLLGGGYERF